MLFVGFESIDSLKVAVMVKLLVCRPLALVELTLVTVGFVLSITIALLAPSELAAPGEASVALSLQAVYSFIVPELSASEVVAVHNLNH